MKRNRTAVQRTDTHKRKMWTTAKKRNRVIYWLHIGRSQNERGLIKILKNVMAFT